MENKIFLIYVCIIIFGLFNFLTSFLLFLIHYKQSYFQQRFFRVIYYIIANECIISLIIIIVSILNIFDVDKTYIFGLFFYFFFYVIIIYNILILYYLLKDSEIDNDLIKKDIKSPKLSISFTPYNFKQYHFFSFGLSIIWIILFFAICIFILDNINEKLFILYDEKKQYFLFLFFIPVYIYAILSFIYMFSSFCSSSKKIKMKFYAVNSIINSIIYLLIPLIYYITIKKNINKDYSNIITFSLNLFSLLSSNIYRINCIYVKSVLNSNDESFCVAFKKGLKIIFCRDTVKGLNIIDFNNPFIYHSLLTAFDFDINNDKIIENDVNISKFAPDL